MSQHTIKALLVAGSVVAACVWSQTSFAAFNSWEEYDEQWVKRNAETRLEILTRAIKHYKRARESVKGDTLADATTAAKDALRVESRFAESYFLLAEIYARQSKPKKALKYQRKGEELSGELSVLEEFEYLRSNLDRLRGMYNPSRALSRIVFYLLFFGGAAIIIFLISASGILDSVALGARHVFRSAKEKREKMPNLVVGEFVGSDEERGMHWALKLIVFLVPFGLCYIIARLCGAERVWDLVIFTLLPGTVIDVLLWKLFFSDDDYTLPPKFGGMR